MKSTSFLMSYQKYTQHINIVGAAQHFSTFTPSLHHSLKIPLCVQCAQKAEIRSPSAPRFFENNTAINRQESERISEIMEM